MSKDKIQGRTPRVMGILNITPDSFYDGSRKQSEQEIAERTQQIIAEGGSIVDVGAFSTRPGAASVSCNEELARMRRGLTIVMRELSCDKGQVQVSIDTFRPEVARMAVEEFGADIINDVSEGGITGIVDTPLEASQEPIPAIFSEVARLGVDYILMSVQPTIDKAIANFRKEIALLRSLGQNRIILDPGYGFGKDVISGNYAMLSQQERFKQEFPDCPLLVGVSRKRMIWHLLNTDAAGALNGTTCVNMLALERGADILRVHDVGQAVEAVRIYQALRDSQ